MSAFYRKPLQLHSHSTSLCLRNVDADEIGLEETGILSSALSKKDSGHQVVRLITNAEVYTRSGLQSIQSIVRRRRLSLFGHVARMPDNVPAKAVLHVVYDVRDRVPPFPNWRRSRGRPPITGLHQICSDYGLAAEDALNCTQDQAVWRDTGQIGDRPDR